MFRLATSIVLLAALGCQPAAQGNADTNANSNMTGDTSNAARGADTSGVTLVLDKTEYSPGADVVMSISSQRSDTLGYNPCSNRSVERDTGSGWVVHPEPNRMCTMELRLLNPGETQTAQTDLPADVTAGTYRIVLRLRPERSDSAPGPTGTVTAASAPFTVGAR